MFVLNIIQNNKFHFKGQTCDQYVTTTVSPYNSQITNNRFVTTTINPCTVIEGNTTCKNNGLCSFDAAGIVTCFCQSGFSGTIINLKKKDFFYY